MKSIDFLLWVKLAHIEANQDISMISYQENINEAINNLANIFIRHIVKTS